VSFDILSRDLRSWYPISY